MDLETLSKLLGMFNLQGEDKPKISPDVLMQLMELLKSKPQEENTLADILGLAGPRSREDVGEGRMFNEQG